MLEHDPEFYRRWTAIMAQLPPEAMPLTIKLNGNNQFQFFSKGRYIGSLNTGMFYRLGPKEVIKQLGMDVDNRVIEAYGVAQGPS
jgi:hypothetical protein